MSDSTSDILKSMTEAAAMGAMPISDAIDKAFELGVLSGTLEGMESARKTFMAGLTVPA